MAVTFDVEDNINQVFQGPRPCHRSVFGDMPDQDRRDAALFGGADEYPCNLTYLRNAARRTVDFGGRDGLDRVNDDQAWVDLFDVGEYRCEVGFGSQHQVVVKCADALRAHSHL